MYFAKELNKFSNIKHCFFSKNGGVSKNIYNSLNCGLGSKDENENVLNNLSIVANKKNPLIRFSIIFYSKLSNNPFGIGI